MKILLINGSPRQNGNTRDALTLMHNVFKEQGFQVEIIQLGGINIRGCQACQSCYKTQDLKCSIQDDLTPIMTKCFDKEVKGIVIGSPTYFSNVTTETKAFIDRVGYVAKNNKGALKNKVGATVTIDRRAGANFVYSAINFFFGINEMPIATSTYWNNGKARKVGELNNDIEGVQTFKNLALNMSNLIKKLND